MNPDPTVDTSGSAPPDGHDGTGTRPAARPAPFLLLAAIVAVAVPLRTALRPLNDVDLYWHLLVGQEILAGTPVADAGRGWSLAPVADTWVSTQWLAEVGLARLHELGGFSALVVYRTATVVAALAVLALTCLRGRPARAGAWPFALAGAALSITSQERSQQITYVLAPLVGWWALRLWRDGRLPRWWLVLPLVVVWANVHGGWILLPAVLVLAALARLLDVRDLRDRAAWLGMLLALGAVPAAAIAPAGLDNVLAAVRFSSSTGLIAEWQRVPPYDWQALPLDLLLVTVVVAWAFGRRRPTAGQVLLVGALLVFGFSAFRSMTPVCLVLAPIVTFTLARALGDDDPLPRGASNPLARLSVGIGAAGAALAMVLAGLQTPAIDPGVPQDLLARVREAGGVQRVLNSYNISGPLLWFGGGPAHVQVGIDGRADRYGGDYIQRYTRGLVDAHPGWQELFDELDPAIAVLDEDEALVEVLVQQRGWIEVAREKGYVLLRAPDAPGWS